MDVIHSFIVIWQNMWQGRFSQALGYLWGIGAIQCSRTIKKSSAGFRTSSMPMFSLMMADFIKDSLTGRSAYKDSFLTLSKTIAPSIFQPGNPDISRTKSKATILMLWPICPWRPPCVSASCRQRLAVSFLSKKVPCIFSLEPVSSPSSEASGSTCKPNRSSWKPSTWA